MTNVLFICTGNYYRSRFAAIYLNHLADNQSLNISARSRGFRLNPVKNKGVLSPHTFSYLKELNIPTNDVGVPVKLEVNDLQEADRIILLDEKEHRAMLRNFFPDWEEKVEFWNFEDDYLVSPAKVLPALQSKVETLAKSIS